MPAGFEDLKEVELQIILYIEKLREEIRKKYETVCRNL